MNKNILLVNPWIYDFAAYDFWLKPLGLLYLGAWLSANNFEVQLIDCLDAFYPELDKEIFIKLPKRKMSGCGSLPRENIEKPHPLNKISRRYKRYGITPRLFLSELKKKNRPDIVLVSSMMTYWYPGVTDTIGLIREVWPGVPIALGGIYATLCHDHAQRKSGADFILAGEGETKLPELLKYLFNIDVSYTVNPANLDSYPWPRIDLIDHIHFIPVLTSKGCPFRCSYCASHLLNKTYRVRDPIRVVDEIEYWHRRLGIKNVTFYDDALFFYTHERSVTFLKEIIRRKLNCIFHCPNGLHLLAMTPDICRLMYEAGFKTIRFGLETTCEDRQAALGAKVNNIEMKEAVLSLRKAGYLPSDIGVYLLCGLPDQTSNEIYESIRFVQSCGARPILAEFSPIPGTPMWEEAVRSALYPISDEPLFHNNSLLPCRHESLSEKTYQKLKTLTRDSLIP